MIRSINFKPVRNVFQKKLADSINSIKSSENLSFFCWQDKKLYEMTSEQFIEVFWNILTNNMTKTYRKAERSTQINIEKQNQFPKLFIWKKRLERYAKRPAFISLKEHKGNSKHNQILSYCSIHRWNGHSKTFLEEINKKLNNDLCHNQWCSTSTVIE